VRYLSVCSGIEAASVAWHHLGWTPVGFSEIEPFPAAVLAHRFPNVPNFGDMTKYEQWPLQPGSIDVLVGGTPCQSFSVAGLRKGLEDPRGNLMLTYLAIAARLRPRWIVWENVPGVLSSNGGRDFGTFLGALGELRYGFAYRVLDAQYVRVGRWPQAVPQRRRRVFVVGCLGDGAAAAEVLAIREGLQRHIEASGKTRKGAASDAEVGARGGGWPARVASTLNHAFGDKLGLEDQHALNGAPLFVPDAVGALTAKGPTAMGAPEVDAQHYIGCYWNGEQVAAALTRKGCDDRMPDKERLFAVLQPTVYRWQNDRDGLQQDDAVAALRESAGSSGFHEMNHPVIAQPVAFRKSKRAQSVTDDESWIRAEQANTLNSFDTGERDTHAVAFTVDMQACKGNANVGDGSVSPTLCKPSGNDVHAVAFNFQGGSQQDQILTGNSVSPALAHASNSHGGHHQPKLFQQVAHAMTVRRLTPVECERLQGFPDNWTLIPWRKKPAEECPDGPRYKALGNSMACNCMAWIGERIAAYEQRGRVDPTPAGTAGIAPAGDLNHEGDRHG